MDEKEVKFLKINDMIIKLVLPFLVLFGTVSNIILMIVISRKVNVSSIMMFVFTINILDTVGLFSEPFWIIIHHWVKNDAVHSVLACQIVMYIYSFVVICTGWITVFVCFEQASVLCFQRKGLVTCKKGVLLVVATVFVSGVTNLYFILDERNFTEEVAMSPMLCHFYKSQLDNVHLKKEEMAGIVYKFSWKWLGKLIGCFFPVTFTVACLIAISQGLKTVVHSDSSAGTAALSTMSQKEKENVRMVYGISIAMITSVVPLTIFKTQISESELAELQLIYTLLSMLIYVNFSMKLVYICAVSSYIRTDVRNLFKAEIIVRKMKKLSKCREPRRMQLGPYDSQESQICLEDACSESDTDMSTSPLSVSDIREFSFNRVLFTCEDAVPISSNC